MEPKVAMTWFAVAEVVGLLLLALGGWATAALWVGVGVAALSAFLHATYLIQRRAAKRMPKQFRERRGQQLVPLHRRRLDRWVLGQWVAIAVIGAGGAKLVALAGWKPLDDVGMVFYVLTVGWVVLWSGVYLSSVVDWFLILPKISGVSCPAPCERPGKQRWAGITGLWSFHRGIARLLVPAVLIGCPTVIGAITDSEAGQAISFSIAAVLAVYLAEFELQGKAALNYGLNSRRYVGDTLWLVRETSDSVSRRPAFLVDVAAEGGKFKWVDDGGSYSGKEFERKHDDTGPPLALTALNDRPPVEEAVAPCGADCTGINWYCWRNPLAHSQTTSAGDG